MYCYRNDHWYKEKDYPKNPYKLIQLALSQDEMYIIGAFMSGYQVWNVNECDRANGEVGYVTLKLPPGIRNIATKMNQSYACVLSAKHTYAVAGIRKELYIWAVKTGELVKCLDAHFARIIDLQSLVVGPWNCVITSSIDRTVKVWNINYIFEQVHHIDRHELQIDSVSVSTSAGIGVVVTRNCIGIWNLITGIKYKSSTFIVRIAANCTIILQESYNPNWLIMLWEL